MPEKVDLGYAVSLPPHRSVEYFRSKGYQITWGWNEMLGEAHNKAFTVAKATKLDVLKTIRSEVDRAISQGITFEQFAASLEPRLQKLGWWGKKAIERPDGVKAVAQLGSKRRLKTIFRTNLSTAYNAGRYKQQKANATNPLLPRPNWQYLAVIDSRTRHTHRELHGKVFRHDDPFWDVFYPPNGWYCRCRVRALTDKQVADRGLAVEDGRASLESFKQKAGVDQMTGEQLEIDATRYRGKDFTVAPDAGFGHNPGEGWAKWDRHGNIPDAGAILPPDRKSLADYGLVSATDMPRSSLPPLPALPGIADQIKELEAKTVKPLLIETPVESVILDRRFVNHIAEKPLKDKAGRAPALVVDVAADPDEVWLSPHSDGSWRRRFIKFYDTGEKNKIFLGVALDGLDGSLAWTSVLTSDARHADGQRYGTLLYSKRKRKGGS